MRLTESRLRALIRSVIKESYGESGGFHELEKHYMRMVRPGANYKPLKDVIMYEYERACGPCDDCEVYGVESFEHGVEFSVRGSNGQVCTGVLERSSFGGPIIHIEVA